jgi:hypothetical protein
LPCLHHRQKHSSLIHTHAALQINSPGLGHRYFTESNLMLRTWFN